MEGYFLAGRSMPRWIIGTSFVATSVSSEQMVGTIGMTYTPGMGIANWEWFALPCYAILILIFLPVLLKSRITTILVVASDVTQTGNEYQGSRHQ